MRVLSLLVLFILVQLVENKPHRKVRYEVNKPIKDALDVSKNKVKDTTGSYHQAPLSRLHIYELDMAIPNDEMEGIVSDLYMQQEPAVDNSESESSESRPQNSENSESSQRSSESSESRPKSSERSESSSESSDIKPKSSERRQKSVGSSESSPESSESGSKGSDDESESSNRKKRAAMKFDRLWRSKTIHYSYSLTYEMTEKEKSAVEQSMKKWSETTCINFVEIPECLEGEPCIKITNDNDGCHSSVGFFTRNPTRTLNLQKNRCYSVSVIVHELGHLLGLFHEQSRTDRDTYVTIVWNNVLEGETGNFRTYSAFTDSRGIPYDYRSIMHYGPKYFSNNGDDTMITTDPEAQSIIGMAPYMSFRDAKVINLMYNCSKSCKPMNCPGEGFQGYDCKCRCPANDGIDTVLCDLDNGEVESTTELSATTTTEQEEAAIMDADGRELEMLEVKQSTTKAPPTTSTITRKTTPTTMTTTAETTTTTDLKPITKATCKNAWTEKLCERRIRYCNWSRRVKKKCKSTCGLC